MSQALALGVGNILWADEGFGVRCVEAMAQRFVLPENLTVADGGTQGLYLVDLFREHDPIVIFDAVDFGDAPGEMRIVEDEDIPAFVAAKKMSLHQVGLQDVIASAKLLGGCAKRMLLIGVQPVELDDYGGSLREAVRAQITPALDVAAEYLSGHGVVLQPRSQSSSTSVITPGLELESYESERPDSIRACRVGDARVFAANGSTAKVS